MKQGTIITKVIMFLFLATVLIYLGYSVFGAIYDPLITTTAVSCTAGESYESTLWLVREESQILADAYLTFPSLADGEKVAAGGEVAKSYRNDEVYDRQQELEEKQARLEQLEYTYREGEDLQLDASTVAELEDRIDAGVAALGYSSAQGDLQAVADQAASLRTLILRRSASDVDQSLLEGSIVSLQQEISELEDQIAVNSNRITVGYAGWFCSTCDGFEPLLTPQTLLQANVTQFQNLTAQAPGTPSRAIGRLVTSATWYAAALVPEAYAGQFERASSVQLDLNHTLTELITMEVESVSAPVDGQCLVVLSCDAYLQDIIHLRTTEAGLVLKLYHGIRVPKEAIRIGEDGSPGVYVVVGARAVFKPVTLLFDNDDTYVVEEDRSSTDYLWVGDEIIVSARNLYDGKVVK